MGFVGGMGRVAPPGLHEPPDGRRQEDADTDGHHHDLELQPDQEQGRAERHDRGPPGAGEHVLRAELRRGRLVHLGPVVGSRMLEHGGDVQQGHGEHAQQDRAGQLLCHQPVGHSGDERQAGQHHEDPARRPHRSK